MTPKWQCGSLWVSVGRWGSLLAGWLATGWLAGHRDPRGDRAHAQMGGIGRSTGLSNTYHVALGYEATSNKASKLRSYQGK